MGRQAENLRDALLDIYHRLYDTYGRQYWWPADAPFEVIIGAILTQSTAWTNVEKAIANLKATDALYPKSIRRIPIEELARLIRPSGYYNAKALKVKAFVERLCTKYDGDLDELFTLDTDSLRHELLSIHGVGEETADSIILYAARRPVFVIDAYTRRILNRLGLAPAKDSYTAYQELFTDNLPSAEKLFNEYHALLVRHGKQVCKKAPLCNDCCLRSMCSK